MTFPVGTCISFRSLQTPHIGKIFCCTVKVLSWLWFIQGFFSHCVPVWILYFKAREKGAKVCQALTVFPLLDLPVSLLASRCLFPPLSLQLVSPFLLLVSLQSPNTSLSSSSSQPWLLPVT